jgi:tetratricopeptide (TPR) repeat protein
MAYFRALADAPSEQCSTWRSTLAGLVGLRLVDAWAEGGPLPGAGIQAFERAINMMDVDAMERPALKRLSDTLLAEKCGRDARAESPVLECLRDYGESLWLGAEWTLGVDACRTAIRHAVTPADHTIVPSLYDRLGNCFRAIGRQDSALEAFETGRALASARGDLASELHLRISEANLEEQLGNSGAAERLLEEVLVDAERAALTHVRARALHDRGVIAYYREDHGRALSLFFQALSAYGTHPRVERVLADIAMVVLEFGFLDIARDAFRALEIYSEERVQRWTAALNLMRIGVLDGDEAAFDFYRRKMADVRLSARLEAHYHLLVSEGWLRFDKPSLAHKALNRAQHTARRYKVNELGERLAHCLLDLQRARTTSERLPAAARQIAPRGQASDVRPFLEPTSAAVLEWRRVRQSQLIAA